MKLLIASDIHGSAYYAQIVVDAFHKQRCDKLIILGDILYHGPRNPLPKDYNPKQVIELLNPLSSKIVACRGNCDSEVDQMVLDFKITSDYEIISMVDYDLFISHGHVYSPDHLPNVKANDVFAFGHIHIPVMKKVNDIVILNPGSISLPKEDTAHSYGVLENHTFTLFDDKHKMIDTFSF